ncbi:MAG: helix-turn-helix transcriptional regulator [bacterium]
MNRVDRLVAIILLLQSRKIIRAKDIAWHFEISIRTVYRDVKALCEAGVPIAAEAGEGYSLVEGYHLPPVMFTQEEASALFLGGKFVEKLTDSSMIENAKSALLKIQSVLPLESQEFLQRLQESTALLVNVRPVESGFCDDTLTTIQDAIVRRRLLVLEYYSNYRDSFSTRNVEPLALIYYSDHWHLIAYCQLRKDYRDFRTDRIKSIKITAEPFQPRQNFSLKKYLSDFYKIEDPIEIQVKFDKRVAGSVGDKHHFGLVEVNPVEDGVIMTFLAPNINWMVPWLLSYGPLVEIISPHTLREALLAEAKNLVKLYQK